MSRAYISRQLREEVILRAANCCEYCQLPAEFAFAPHEIDHIIAEQHEGPTTIENLAFSCFDCNKHKGPNIASIDPVEGTIVRLFNPRVEEWNSHFEEVDGKIKPLTPVGRATAKLLQFNHPQRVLIRKSMK